MKSDQYVRYSVPSPQNPFSFEDGRATEYDVLVRRDECPAEVEELAEAYMLGMLSKEEAATFEFHYITCARCAAVLEKTAIFVRAIREAAQARECEPNALAATHKPN